MRRKTWPFKRESGKDIETDMVLSLSIEAAVCLLVHLFTKVGGQEVISRCRLLLGGIDGIEDVLTAACDAGQLVPGHTLRVHLDHVYRRLGWNRVVVNVL